MPKHEPSLNIKSYIKAFEALRLKSYLCSAGVWTIGWGTTIYPNGNKVSKNEVCLEYQAQRYFDYDIGKFSEFINRIVKVRLNNNQLDALVSLVYNIGVGNFSRSTLLKALNSGDYKKASNQFLLWCKARNPATKKLVVLRGLQSRRKKEKKIFDTPLSSKYYINYFNKLKARGYAYIYKKNHIFNVFNIRLQDKRTII